MVQVGDIVKTKDTEGEKLSFAVVTKTYTYKTFSSSGPCVMTSVNMMFSDGSFGKRSDGKYKETGRHTDIQSILDSIK